MAKTNEITGLADRLWKEQSEQNWDVFRKALGKSSVVYYRVVFANEGKLTKMQDLTKSCAELYDAEYKLVTKVPIFKKEGKKLRGATIYLVGLKVYNK